MELAVNMPEQEPQVGQPVFQLQELIIIDFADLVSADAFKYGGQGQFAAFAVHAGFHRPAADKHRRDIDAQGTHQHAGRDFITVRDTYHAIEPVSRYNGF